MDVDRPTWEFGRRLTKVERQDRMRALREVIGLRLPQELLREIWPRPFQADGTLTRCNFPTLTDDHLPPGLITYEGHRRMAVELAVEVACAIPIERPWKAIPHHCGNRSCCEPHHWEVLTGDGPIPSARMLNGPRAGFHRAYRTTDIEPLSELILRMDDWQSTATSMLQSRFPYYPQAIVEMAHRRAKATGQSDSTF